jgi:Nitroreductase family
MLLGGSSIALMGMGATYLAVRNMGSMADYAEAAAATRAVLKPMPEARDIIRYATLAANSHNTQPWRFAANDRGIDIRPDLARRLPAVDLDNHHLFASIGCAAENLSIAAQMRGKPGELIFDQANGGGVTFVYGKGANKEAALFDAIPRRQSTRGLFDGRPVSAADLATLSKAAVVPGVDLILISDRSQIDRIRDLVLAGNSVQMTDEAFVRELKSWLRFSPAYAMEMGDGLFSASSGNPALPQWLGPTLFDLAFKVAAENDKYARHIASSAGIAVFIGQKDDAEHWVLAGRACQRFALAATALGLKHAFLNQPVEVPSLRPELAKLVGTPGRRPDIVMRFGYGPALPFSARRPVDAVITI